MHTIGSTLGWVLFIVFVLAMLALDLLVFNRKAHRPSMKESIAWSVVWIAVSLAFCGGMALWVGPTQGLEFLAGYLIEKSLSVDNLFVFLLLFRYFNVPLEDQHRVLFWGILGAIVTRAIFILAGAALLEAFDFMFYLFGGFLVFTAIKMVVHTDEEVHPDRNVILRLLRRVVPMTNTFSGHRFFVRDGGRLLATPMLGVLVAVETTDVVFAVDSIPAVFGVTRDPFIVFTSNIFAILGLRALYFVLAGALGALRYLKQGLALILLFVGVKMLISDVWHAPVAVSLGVIGGILAIATVASVLADRYDREHRKD